MLFQTLSQDNGIEKMEYKNKMVYFDFHSQFGEDKFLVENLDLPAKGVFVDIGAGDPVTFSNTYHFERNGWIGLCVDGDERRFEQLKVKRQFVEHAVVSREKNKVNFLKAPHPDLSKRLQFGDKIERAEIVQLETKPLSELLDKYKMTRIDILSVDVEGFEIDVLASFDLLKFAPTVIIVEFLAMDKNQEKELMEFFAPLPYSVIHKTTANLILLHHEKSNLLNK